MKLSLRVNRFSSLSIDDSLPQKQAALAATTATASTIPTTTTATAVATATTIPTTTTATATDKNNFRYRLSIFRSEDQS